MALHDLTSVDPYNEDTTAEEFLAQFDAYIVALVVKRTHYNSSNVDSQEIDEIVQNVRIKLWQASRRTSVVHSKAYISCIVRNVLIDRARQEKRAVFLAMDGESELYQGEGLMVPSKGMQDPLYEPELDERASEHIMQAVEALLSLLSCQRQVIICSLKERLDDVLTTRRGIQRAARNKSSTLCSSKLLLSPDVGPVYQLREIQGLLMVC